MNDFKLLNDTITDCIRLIRKIVDILFSFNKRINLLEQQIKQQQGN